MNLCTYCGAVAADRDHIVPCAALGRRSFRDEWVWACSECNSLLIDWPVHGVVERARWLAKKYRDRYRKLLRSPLWDETELEELGPSLRDAIEADMKKRQLLEARLKHIEGVA